MTNDLLDLIDKLWGEHEIEEDHASYFEIGPLKLWVKRLAHEWQILSKSCNDLKDKSLKVDLALPEDRVPVDHNHLKRFCLKQSDSFFSFGPSLPNLPVVVRPEDAFYLPPKEETTLYITTSLWLKFLIGKESKYLMEFPICELSDTWFGPSQMEGEFCYSAMTSAKLRFADLALSPFRAVTKVYIKNMADTPLFLDKIKIPVQALSLYKSNEGPFATEGIVIVREKNGENVRISLSKAPRISQLTGLKKIASARTPLEGTFLNKAMSSLFGMKDMGGN